MSHYASLINHRAMTAAGWIPCPTVTVEKRQTQQRKKRNLPSELHTQLGQSKHRSPNFGGAERAEALMRLWFRYFACSRFYPASHFTTSWIVTAADWENYATPEISFSPLPGNQIECWQLTFSISFYLLFRYQTGSHLKIVYWLQDSYNIQTFK